MYKIIENETLKHVNMCLILRLFALEKFVFDHETQMFNRRCSFLLSRRPVSTSSSTSSSPAASSRWPPGARTRRSSECASTSSSCPSASSCRRKTKAPLPSRRRRCVCVCVWHYVPAPLLSTGVHLCAPTCEFIDSPARRCLYTRAAHCVLFLRDSS